MERGTVKGTMDKGGDSQRKGGGKASTGICNRGRKFAWPVQNKLLTGSVLFKPGKIPPPKKKIRNLPRV